MADIFILMQTAKLCMRNANPENSAGHADGANCFGVGIERSIDFRSKEMRGPESRKGVVG
jgi:hypothetical protein